MYFLPRKRRILIQSSLSKLAFVYVMVLCHRLHKLWARFNINTTSFGYSVSHYGDKTVMRPNYFHNGRHFTTKAAFTLCFVQLKICSLLCRLSSLHDFIRSTWLITTLKPLTRATFWRFNLVDILKTVEAAQLSGPAATSRVAGLAVAVFH